MAGVYEVLSVSAKGNPRARLINAVEIEEGIIFREAICDEPEEGQIRPSGDSRLVYKAYDSDEIVPLIYHAEDARDLGDHMFSCTVLRDSIDEKGLPCKMPNIGVFEFKDGFARQRGEGDEYLGSLIPKNFIKFRGQLQNGGYMGHVRIWKDPLTGKDRPTIRKIHLPNWGNGASNYLEGAILGETVAEPGKTTQVVGDSTIPFAMTEDWVAFYHSATSIDDPNRFYEQSIWGYDPKTWEIIWKTDIPMVTIDDCPIELKKWWVKNAVYILKAKCVDRFVKFLVCFADYVICRGTISLDEINAHRVDVEPGKVIVAESSR